MIVCFEYAQSKILPGSIVDLYLAYKWCSSFCDRIHILTDITNNNNILRAIDKYICEPVAVEFYENVPNKHIVNTGVSLMDTMRKVITEHNLDDRLIIYYSGHGVNNFMVIPDQQLLPFIDFRKCITDSVSLQAEIFCILDCCNPQGMGLPYKLKDNTFRLCEENFTCCTNSMLVMTSSGVHEESYATTSGSIFTSSLLEYLTTLSSPFSISVVDGQTVIPTTRNRNLHRLIKETTRSMRDVKKDHEEKIAIYSSYIVDPILWMWIGSKSKYDVVPDISGSALIIR